MKKEYPLEIVNASLDAYCYFSKGHHEAETFMKAVVEYGVEGLPLGKPEHLWAKVTPDSTGECTCLYHFVDKRVRGAFPVTCTFEDYSSFEYSKA